MFVELTVCHTYTLCWWFDNLKIKKILPSYCIQGFNIWAWREERCIHSGIHYGFLGLWHYEETARGKQGKPFTSLDLGILRRKVVGNECCRSWAGIIAGVEKVNYQAFWKKTMKEAQGRMKQVGGVVSLGLTRTDKFALSGHPQEAVQNHSSCSVKVLETPRSSWQTTEQDTICFWRCHLSSRASNEKG